MIVSSNVSVIITGQRGDESDLTPKNKHFLHIVLPLLRTRYRYNMGRQTMQVICLLAKRDCRGGEFNGMG